MSKPKRKTQNQINAEALAKIAAMGDGMKESIIDWPNIGKNAKHIAAEALRVKCKECGR